jgi:hypothetical protein
VGWPGVQGGVAASSSATPIDPPRQQELEREAADPPQQGEHQPQGQEEEEDSLLQFADPCSGKLRRLSELLLPPTPAAAASPGRPPTSFIGSQWAQTPRHGDPINTALGGEGGAPTTAAEDGALDTMHGAMTLDVVCPAGVRAAVMMRRARR